ncbi:uncharacterized protein LOC144712471 [Wolffia australiana]
MEPLDVNWVDEILRDLAGDFVFPAAPDACPGLVEEDLEWISNKDAFPKLETFAAAAAAEPAAPPFPRRARSEGRRRRRRVMQIFPGAEEMAGRKCWHCGAGETPQWRAGPNGPKTLCNACGVRYKSGRLVPEYRPANSPTFSSAIHSNSHREIMEMRRRKEGQGMPPSGAAAAAAAAAARKKKKKKKKKRKGIRLL